MFSHAYFPLANNVSCASFSRPQYFLAPPPRSPTIFSRSSFPLSYIMCSRAFPLIHVMCSRTVICREHCREIGADIQSIVLYAHLSACLQVSVNGAAVPNTLFRLVPILPTALSVQFCVVQPSCAHCSHVYTIFWGRGWPGVARGGEGE